mmetsp:Transcript_30496/g.45415  ORF Transcript_30496/g.45415 Transcript_30496/m.45415 type:complete len:207 (-) Transcript_30496:684-1304(-)
MRHLSLALAAICCLGHHAAAFSPHGVRHSTRSNVMKYSQNSRVRMTETTSDSAPPTQKQFDFSDPLKPVVFGEELIIPFTGKSINHGNMVNDGMYSWMYPYMKLIGLKPGNTMVGLKVAEGSSDLSESEMEALRQKAAEEMTNISDLERESRRELGNTLYAVSAIYAAISAILFDDGTFSGHLARFAVVLPLTFARGLEMSANRGL